MRTTVRTQWIAITLSTVSLLLTGCGNSNPMLETNLSVLVVLPGRAAVSSGQSVQFSTSPTVALGVTWMVNSVAGGNSTVGTIDSSGHYVAPAVTGPATFQVQAQAGSILSAPVPVTVLAPGVVSTTANPQVAQYALAIPAGASVAVEFGPDTTYGLTTWSQPAPAGGGTVSMLVAGMRAFTTYHLRAAVQLAGGLEFDDLDHTFTTGGLPANRLPALTIKQPPGPGTNPGIELVGLSYETGNPIEAFAMDLSGNIIWYYDFDTTGAGFPFPMKLLPNGHIKLIIANYPVGLSLDVVREVDLAGNTISEETLAGLNASLSQAGSTIVATAFHHDFLDLPNGDTIYLVSQEENLSDVAGYPGMNIVIGDALVELDPTGKVVWTWSAFDHLDVNYHPFGFPDWTHANAVIYSPSDGNLILSSRSLSWVMKIQYQDGAGNGDVLWKLGTQGDFTMQGADTGWFYNQHFPVLIGSASTGQFELGVWDNGNTRPDPASGLPCGTPGAANCYSRGVLLNLDESAKTAEVAWQDPLKIASICCGDINVLGNGNVEMGLGDTSFSPATTGALEVTQTSPPQVVWQLYVTGQGSYRIYRVPSLYPGVQW
ncbi:MAG TPA: aryl-sulfate sulfotransferase [Terriglobia bacterium]|nr:aryl-sulfate sulfotransferase [Terriglobia bacterium]